MGMTGTVGNAVGKRRHRRTAVMSDINVTPMVDVMLVLLIVFMVSAPLLTVGVPVDLPQTQAKSLDKGQEPLVVSLTNKGDVYLQSSDTPTPIDDLVAKLKAITDARGSGLDERIYVRADRAADWGAVMKVMGRLSAAGFKKVALVTEVERGP
jgi:biopolymer transport protein TolR